MLGLPGEECFRTHPKAGGAGIADHPMDVILLERRSARFPARQDFLLIFEIEFSREKLLLALQLIDPNTLPVLILQLVLHLPDSPALSHGGRIPTVRRELF
jgi:hypothetical protein